MKHWQPRMKNSNRMKSWNSSCEYTDVKGLNPELLYQLIDHIEIGQGHYEKGKHGKVKRQSVKIWFRFRGAPVTKEYEI